MTCPTNGTLEYDVLFALGYSGTVSGPLPAREVLFCVKFSILTVHPEHANAKPATMRVIRTALKSFIDTSIAPVSNISCGGRKTASLNGGNDCPQSCVSELSGEPKGLKLVRWDRQSKSFTFAVVYIVRG
jgi:hypothetical protein